MVDSGDGYGLCIGAPQKGEQNYPSVRYGHLSLSEGITVIRSQMTKGYGAEGAG